MKILLITEIISHYRVPFFNALHESHGNELTIAFNKREQSNEIEKYKSFQYHLYSFLDKIYYFNIPNKLTNEADFIICTYNLRFLAIYKLLISKNRPILLWGIGLSSDTGIGTKNVFLDFLRIWCAKKANGLIFYSKFPFDFYTNHGIPKNKLFSADNTIKWTPIPEFNLVKTDILFIGRLYFKKRVDLLIDIINKVKLNGLKNITLNIIGNGPEEEKLINKVLELNLSKNIIFKGVITDEFELQNLYNKSLLCISPGQAGLTVLQSFAAGVTFVTTENAITGGELFSIETGINGIILKDLNELANLIKDALENPKKYIEIGKNARLSYESKYSISNMVSNFNTAIEYCTNNLLE